MKAEGSPRALETRSTAARAHLLRHIPAAAFFVILASIWTLPLAQHLSTHLLGRLAGDNVDFLWNFWWMRTAVESQLNFFHTRYLFVPIGADLTLHTNTALQAFIGATVFRPFPIVAALNLSILAALSLNGFCAYLLAWRITSDRGASAIAGVVYGFSPYISAHLHGHFNLTTAWTMPLVAIAASEAAKPSARWAVVAGLVLGITAYIDYYYLVYGFALAVCIVVLATLDWSIAWNRPTTATRRLSRVVAVLVLVDLAAIAAIVVSGGFSVQIGSQRLSAHDPFNLLQVFWILIILWLWLQRRPRVVALRHAQRPQTRVARTIMIVTGSLLVVAAPLVWGGVRLLSHGGYVTQRYFWRSAPKGIDVATLVLGNPFHGLWGDAVQRAYGTMGIDMIESTGWLGIAPVVLAAWALRQSAHRPLGDSIARFVRSWAVLGLLFFVWALGPHLMAFGVNTGMILPQALLRYVPFVANARIPSRAIVVSYLALSVLTAVAAADWRRRFRHGHLALLTIGALVMADYIAAPFEIVAMDRPPIYEMLRDRPEPGAVCELPLGIRDGFGGRGMFDDRVLFYQTIHQRPMTGGFVARLSPAVAAVYENDPLLAALLSLSETRSGIAPTRSLPNRQRAADSLMRNGITFVVLNRRTAPVGLVAYVERVLPLTLLSQDDGRVLYLVSPRGVVSDTVQ
jgi:hypothetical protein